MQGYPAVGGSSILWAGQGAAFNPMQPMNQFTDLGLLPTISSSRLSHSTAISVPWRRPRFD
ncbi:uncharacterized protein P884DRAFT_317400 [Thermothelomyces heterothallicus CBS 202.75]|uniref:uncharacterized protein n=1 Tax=Thermothelomyces heterothallicus CBS 202.75 TaxID=1149848 RepID=UPI0037425A19